mmetsp:Transcript_38447/g.82620  ORF Transcript_38447/g.82620 Transcript_38447/m.82620 type:complete len:511 (+) Transcript_38447:82-1614(+)
MNRSWRRLKTLSFSQVTSLSFSDSDWEVDSASLRNALVEGDDKAGEGAGEGEASLGGLAREVVRSGAWRMLPLLLILGICWSMILPAMPNYCTNFFASTSAAKPLRCEDFLVAEAPPPCVDAHWQCVQYQSLWQLLINSVLVFTLAPVFGKLSDRYGRKFFLLLGTLLAALPVYAFYLMTKGYGNYLVTYPFMSLGTAFGPLGPALAYVSDLVSKKYRTQALSMLLGELFLGVIFGPPLSKLWREETSAILACVCATLAIVYALTVPESLREDKREKRHGNDGDGVGGVPAEFPMIRTKSLKQVMSLARSKFFALMAVIACIGSMTSEGSQEISAQYLQLVNGFTPDDQANLITIIGVMGLLTQFVLVPLLLSWVPPRKEKYLIAGTNFLLIFVNLGIAFFAANKSVAICLLSVGFISILSFSVSTGMLSKAVSERHQGLVTGVISGLRAQAYGVGPLVYACLFRLFSSTENKLPYFPGAPFAFSAVMMLLASILALLLGNDEAVIDIED